MPAPTLPLHTHPLHTASPLPTARAIAPWAWWGLGLGTASLGLQSLGQLPTFPSPIAALLMQAWGPWLCLILALLGSIAVLKHPAPLAWQAIAHTLLAALAGAALGWGEAATSLAQRVPTNCHKHVITSTFMLTNRILRPNHDYSWQLRHVEAHPCLAVGSTLEVRAPKASANENNTASSSTQPTSTQPPAKLGQLWQATVQLRSPRATLPLQGFDANRAIFMSGIDGWGSVLAWSPSPIKPVFDLIQTLQNSLAQQRLNLANWLIQSLEGHPQQGLVLALVLGDQGLISAPERALYADAGIAHLVAISGLHITMLASVMGFVAAHLWRRSAKACLWVPAPWVGRWAGVLFAVLYAALAGWAVPAQRTVWMLSLWALAYSRTVHCSPWWPWWGAWCLCLATHPFAVLDTGFVLSFGAVAVLIAAHHGRMQLQPRQAGWLGFWSVLHPFLYTQMVVTLGLVVPSAILFHQVSLASVWVNVLSIPWMSLVSTPLALLGGLLTHHGLLHLAAQSLEFQNTWLAWVAHLAWSTWWVPVQPLWIYGLALLGAVLCLLPRGFLPVPWALGRWTEGGWLWGVSLMASLAWPAPRPKPGEFWVDVLDIGQGNAVVVRTHSRTLLYDTGPAASINQDSGLRQVLPWMRQNGVRSLDALWVSHADNDHAGGAATVLKSMPVRQFVHSMPNTHPLASLAAQNTIASHNCHEQAAWEWDGIGFEPLAVARKGHSNNSNNSNSDNNQSCVLRIRTAKHEHSLLLAGDIEHEAEWQLLRQHPGSALQARVLLVPHHGSLTSSTPQWLEAVGPELAIVQSGWGNRYGHPHPTVLARYQNRNIAVYNTAEHGALALQFTPQVPQWHSTSALQVRRRFWHWGW